MKVFAIKLVGCTIVFTFYESIISGILVNFKKPGLENEALGNLSDLTPDR